ncbi:PD-(D/E)XK nuclease family protein [Elusimicrobiota bacterium]
MAQVINLAINENSIQSIANYINDQYIKKDADLSKIAFVFGGKRPSIFLKRELARKAGKSFISPKFFSMNEFIRHIVQKHDNISSVSNIDSSYSIYRYVKELAPDMIKDRTDFVKFLPWANEIRAFIDHLDMECVDNEKLKSVQSSASIGYDVPKEINMMLSYISEIRDKFHTELRAKKAYSEGLWYLEASKLIESTQDLGFEKIYFCNFLYLHETELRILKNLKEKGTARFFFQGDKAEWPILESTAKYLSLDITTPKAKTNYNLNLYSGFDTHSQSSIVKEITKTIKVKDNAVLVVPDEEAIIPVLAEITQEVESFNVSLGYPLRKTPVFSLLEDILNSQNTKKEDSYYVKDYIQVLKHPFVKNLTLSKGADTTRVIIHKIEEALSGAHIKSHFAGNLFVNPEDIEKDKSLITSTIETLQHMDILASNDDVGKVIRELHETLFAKWTDIKSFSDLLSALSNLISIIIPGYASAYSLNVKSFEKILTIIEDFKSSTFITQEFSKEDILKLFKEYILDEKITFAGSPLKGFQILGSLESRSLNFDDVIIMDMNESVMPSLRMQEPLIPRDIMLGLGLSRVEKEEEIQRYHFKRLISSAKNVHLVYSENDKNEKSRFIEELVWENQKKENSIKGPDIKRAKYNITIPQERGEQPKTEEVCNYLKSLKFSPSSVDTYLKCPKSFYFKYVLGLKEKEGIAKDVEGRDVGNFIHGFLEDIFKEFVGTEFKIDKAFKDRFFLKLESSFEAEFSNRMRSDIFLLKDVVNYALKKFVDAEERRSHDVANIVSLEERIVDSLEFGKEKYNFVTKVDRIDLLRDGSILILDYKTGAIHKTQGLKSLSSLAFDMDRKTIKKKIQSFQLPIYMHFVSKNKENSRIDAGLYGLKETTIEHFFKKDDNDIERDSKMDICMKALEFMLSEIINPDTPFVADVGEQCKNCPFFFNCR